MRDFLSWAQRHYCIDVTASTVERKTDGLASAGTCPGGCKKFSRKSSNAHSIRLTCKICGAVRKDERHPQREDPATRVHRHTDHRGATHTCERRIVLIVELQVGGQENTQTSHLLQTKKAEAKTTKAQVRRTPGYALNPQSCHIYLFQTTNALSVESVFSRLCICSWP